MTYLDFIEQAPLVHDVESCTTTGDIEYPGTAFEVRLPTGEEVLHVVVDGTGEQQVLLLNHEHPFRMPLELLERLLAKARKVVRRA